MSEAASRHGAPLDELAELAQRLTVVQAEELPVVADVFGSRGGGQPPFDHLHDFWFNFADGPRDGVPPMPATAPVLPTRLLDFEVGFPLGVPACALTPHAAYIDYFAARGFDLLTYKTVRDRAWNPHPFPQWAFVPQLSGPLSEGDLDQEQIRTEVVATLDPREVADFKRASLVNSFGVPSLPVEQWKADISDSKSTLSSRQVLIVSVMGSPDDPDTRDDAQLMRQFAATAVDAAEAGADVIELNLSCPNTGGDLICSHPALSAEVARAVKEALKLYDVPIFIKISYLESNTLRDLVEQCQPHIQGIVAINTVSAPTIGRNGKTFFPSYRKSDGRTIDRPKAGVSGIAIRDYGLKTARELVSLRETHRATTDWVIIGVGGVMSAADFKAYRDEGVDAVQSCSGAWLNPRLALELRDEFGRPPRDDEVPSKERHPLAAAIGKFGELLATGGLSTRSRG
jgi:dihydroorotate dehydrogenase